MGAVGCCVAIGEEVGKEVIELLARGEITVVAFGANGVNERGDGDKATSEGGVLRQGLHFFHIRTVSHRIGGWSGRAMHFFSGRIEILYIAGRESVREKGTIDAYCVANPFEADRHVRRTVACGEIIGVGDVALVLQTAVLDVLDVAGLVVAVRLVLVSAEIAVE